MLLASRKLTSCSSNVSLYPIGQLGNDPGRVGLLQGFLDVLISRTRVPIEEVFPDRLVKKNWFLTDVADLASQVLQVHPSNVVSVDGHASLVSVVEALDELHARAFP